MGEGRSIKNTLHVLGEKLALRLSHTRIFSGLTADRAVGCPMTRPLVLEVRRAKQEGVAGCHPQLRSPEPTLPTAAFATVTARVPLASPHGHRPSARGVRSLPSACDRGPVAARSRRARSGRTGVQALPAAGRSLGPTRAGGGEAAARPSLTTGSPRRRLYRAGISWFPGAIAKVMWGKWQRPSARSLCRPALGRTAPDARNRAT